MPRLQSHTNTSQSQTNTSRFHYPECNETRSWQTIAETYKSARSMFATGSMGALASADFKVWACFRGHPCLNKVATGPSLYTDAMCYMYREKEGSWHPWSLMSEMPQCQSLS